MTECPPRDALRSYGLEQAHLNGVPGGMFDRQIGQESNWEHCRPDGSLKVSSGNAVGVAQIIQKWHPTVDATDPWASLRYSTEMMADLHQRFGSWRFALAAFNWGPGNVGGYTDSAGRVHPAWDGTREWRCPHEAVVAQCRTAQRDHYLDVILGPGWPEPAEATPEPSPVILYEDYRDPAPAGRFTAMPNGIVLHGSRSGKAGNPRDQEYLGTARWEQTNPAGLGWHATIGDGKVALHLMAQEWGWHAKAASPTWLGVEFVQPTVDDAITDEQVTAFADWFKSRVLAAWPALPLDFRSHAEIDRDFNQQQGKTDVFPLGDARMDELRARIMATLGQGEPMPVPEQPPYEIGPGILAAMQARGDTPASDEVFTKRGEVDEWSEAYGASGRRYLWLPAVGRVFVYDPAA